MNITKITVNAGRTFNHPHEQYSNLRSDVTLHADLTEGEDPSAAVRQLQTQAETLAEDHKRNLLRSIEELRELSEMRAEVQGLTTGLTKAQKRLEEIRQRHPELTQIPETGESAPENSQSN